VPEDVRNEMSFHLAETIDQVLEYSLCPAPPVEQAEDPVNKGVDALTPVEMALN
jgi:hypothetical protein